MPTYAYRCADCGHRFETVQSFTDEALTVCPVCNGVLRKVFNAVGVVFKGSGFYRTDSRAAALASAGNGSEANGSGSEANGKGSDAKSSEAGGSGTTKANAAESGAPAGAPAGRNGKGTSAAGGSGSAGSSGSRSGSSAGSNPTSSAH